METGYDVEEISVGKSEISEDIIAVKVEYATNKNERMQMVMIVCYMTVEGVRSERDKREKYACIKKVLDEYRGGRVAQWLKLRVPRLVQRGAGSIPTLCASFWSESARRPGG
jgi:hypothetical protein